MYTSWFWGPELSFIEQTAPADPTPNACPAQRQKKKIIIESSFKSRVGYNVVCTAPENSFEKCCYSSVVSNEEVICVHIVNLNCCSTFFVRPKTAYLAHSLFTTVTMLTKMYFIRYIHILRQLGYVGFFLIHPLCQQKYSTEQQPKLPFSDPTHPVLLLT